LIHPSNFLSPSIHPSIHRVFSLHPSPPSIHASIHRLASVFSWCCRCVCLISPRCS
jgi:hypothetical protein